MVCVNKIEHFFHKVFLHFKILKCPHCIPVPYTRPIQPINRTVALEIWGFYSCDCLL